ncbi:MAG: MFS transporter [Clostridiales bacterium]|nr:MFS transporter [Clostridiales bacterium]
MIKATVNSYISVYMTDTYIMCGMCVTGLTMPQQSLIPAMTKDDGERGFMVQFDIIMVAVAFTIDYIQLKEGLSMNGIISAVKGFAYKMGSTATNSGILAILAATGYVAGAVGDQNAATITAMNWLRFGIPAICCALIIVFLLRYPIRPYRDETASIKEKMKANDEQ